LRRKRKRKKKDGREKELCLIGQLLPLFSLMSSYLIEVIKRGGKRGGEERGRKRRREDGRLITRTERGNRLSIEKKKKGGGEGRSKEQARWAQRGDPPPI